MGRKQSEREKCKDLWGFFTFPISFLEQSLYNEENKMGGMYYDHICPAN
jgi:hypothetical protein